MTHLPPIHSQPPRSVPGRPFERGNPGRPIGSRNLLSKDFLKALHDDFRMHGAAAIVGAREESPLGYCKIIAALLPTRQDVQVSTSTMTDDELLAIASKALQTIEHEPEDWPALAESVASSRR